MKCATNANEDRLPMSSPAARRSGGNGGAAATGTAPTASRTLVVACAAPSTAASFGWSTMTGGKAGLLGERTECLRGGRAAGAVHAGQLVVGDVGGVTASRAT